MAEKEPRYPLRKQVPSREWSPGIHYAQFQTLSPCLFPRRRLYDFELLYVRQGKLSTKMDTEEYILNSGQLIFLSSGVYHQNAIVSDSETKLIGIHFDFFGESIITSDEDMLVNEEEVIREVCLGSCDRSFYAIVTGAHLYPATRMYSCDGTARA